MNLKAKLALMSVTGVTAIGAIVGGATYALFTSSATNQHNAFTAGTLNLTENRDSGDTIPGPMFYTSISDSTGSFPYDTNKNAPYQPPGGESIGGMAPGDSITRAMNLFNNGPNAIDAKVTKLKATVNAAGLTSGPAYNEFISKLNVVVALPNLGDRIVYNGPLSGLLNGHDNGWSDIATPLVMRANGGPMNVSFKVTLDPSADNLIQGKTFVFDFSFYAEQLRNNPDLLSGMTWGSISTDPQFSAPASSGIWNTSNANNGVTNGVPLLFSTTVDTTTSSLNIHFNTDDVSELYIDGRPVWVESDWAQVQSLTENVTPGAHLIQFFAENTDGQQDNGGTVHYNTGNNPASLNATVQDASGATLASTANPAQWTVQQPSGTPNPYMFGSTTQSSGAFDPTQANYSGSSGVPIGPQTTNP